MRKLKAPDASRIYGIVKASKKDMYGLVKRGDTYHLLFFDAKGRTNTMSLHTSCPVQATRMRNKLYGEAVAAGRGGQTGMQRRCAEILRNPECNTGLKFVVYLNNRVVTCSSYKDALREREKICKEVLRQA